MNTKKKNPVITNPMKNKSRDKRKGINMTYHVILSLLQYIFRSLCFTTRKGDLSSLAVKHREAANTLFWKGQF